MLAGIVPEPLTVIESTITELRRRRGAEDIEIGRDAALMDDLGLDSLDLAELSAALEDELGRDPFSEGVLPRTVAELVAWYT